MKKTFKINNEIDLGEAIWASKDGDKIVFQKGEYGNIPYKKGISYIFPKDKSVSVANILGIGFFGELSGGSIKNKDFSVENPNIRPQNIKSIYIFRKKLPFNIRFGCPLGFVHANGVVLNFSGNDKESFCMGGEQSLPKGIVEIIVPILEEIDIERSDPFYSSKIFGMDISKKEKEIKCKKHKNAKQKRVETEQLECNREIGLNLNDMEYKALWALNHFIRQYGKVAEDKRIKGFSVAEFKDNLEFGGGKEEEDIPCVSLNYIEQYSSGKISQESLNDLQDLFLSSPDYSVMDYVEFHLNHLNYSLATIGMYQWFEGLWKNSDSPGDKWEFIGSKTSDVKIKQYLSEMINARNNTVHHKKLETRQTEKNKLKTDWGAEEMTEYKMFANKRPWLWYSTLRDFE
ncbi:hypothetical protein K8R20_03370 [bacterium]|nr:hypothetical protein [bacterium]